MAALESRYPHLFCQTDIGINGMTAHFKRLAAPPPPHLISNINCVPFIDEHCVIITLANGDVGIPGGTLEPGEFYEAALRRELIEEVGARLVRFELLGAWHTYSALAQPYRPHLPHPEGYRFVVYGDIELTGRPTNPAGGEQVASVDVMHVSEAAARFRAVERAELAELYELAADLRKRRR